jgi:hypothetical protein
MAYLFFGYEWQVKNLIHLYSSSSLVLPKQMELGVIFSVICSSYFLSNWADFEQQSIKLSQYGLAVNSKSNLANTQLSV